MRLGERVVLVSTTTARSWSKFNLASFANYLQAPKGAETYLVPYPYYTTQLCLRSFISEQNPKWAAIRKYDCSTRRILREPPPETRRREHRTV